MNLKTVFEQHTDRHCGKWSHYFDVYDRYLQSYIGKEFTLLEIGVAHGGSLQIWKRYFGDKVKIVGIDIGQSTMFNEPQIQTFCGSQSDTAFLETVIKQVGIPDVVIDDGSHQPQDVLTSFNFLFPKMTQGLYVVEDTHVAYWNGNHNYVTQFSQLVHDVSTQHIENFNPVFSKDIKSISFYDSMVILEKEPHVTKHIVTTGTLQF